MSGAPATSAAITSVAPALAVGGCESDTGPSTAHTSAVPEDVTGLQPTTPADETGT
ncbi:hypothetical protein ACFYV5_04675 [Streptomyces sp. NPDC003035]|uniref:hypothetical protein n=1 Tax=Streptomyces sp. NPDC003035 TaxID=3364676 RepID=UPI0036C7338F